MPNATAAEWILSLATTPDRAASTAGDLVEESSARGALWFCSNVLRTVCRHVWSDLHASPLRMLGHALWGGLAIVWFSFSLGLMASCLVRVPTAWGTAPTPWGPVMVVVAMATCIPFFVGWEVARRSAGRELAAIFMVVALCETLDAVAVCLSTRPWPRMGGPLTEVAKICVQAFFLIAGAILFRRRTLAKQKLAS